MDIEATLEQLTLTEKVKLLSGEDFWHTAANDKYGISSLTLTDGPHGLRKQDAKGDHLGIRDSIPATCFPTSSASACSFDINLLYKIGRALGEECRKEDVAVLLGPGVNIKRNPLCGRNFEYFSEDPYLSGKLAAGYIKGVQSCGVGTSLKHFAGNNQERNRNWANSLIDERALREIYLKAFEIAIKEAQPWTVMTAYNRLNGAFCAENKELMTHIARTEWGFDGLFVTDWGGMSDPVSSYEAGLDLEMPGTFKGTDKVLIEAFQKGEIAEQIINERAGTLIKLVEKCEQGKKIPVACDMGEHLSLAREVVEQSAVLLENSGVLPLKDYKKIAVIGNMAKKPRYQGAGSSKINALEMDNLCEALDKRGIAYDFAQGYPEDDGLNPDSKLIADACEAAKGKDAVIIVAGLPDIWESEGYDRTTLELPPAHNALIEAVTAENPNVIVVLQCGSPVLLPWRKKVAAVLLTYLSGCQGGSATLRLLMGDVNPSGKLAETWPLCLEDVPNNSMFSTDAEHVEYRDSIFVGYRYYDTAKVKVAYPFGYGLSYTHFSYENISVSDGCIELDLINSGAVYGGEVVQLYVGMQQSKLYRAKKELKGFEKIWLMPGERKRVRFKLDREAYAYWDIDDHKWLVEKGSYTLYVGSSSQDIRFEVSNDITQGKEIGKQTCYPVALATQQQFETILGIEVPPNTPVKPYTVNSLLGTTRGSLLGRIMLRFSIPIAAKHIGKGPEAMRMAKATIEEMPIRGLGMSGMSRMQVDGIVKLFNGKLIKGIKCLIRKDKD